MVSCDYEFWNPKLLCFGLGFLKIVRATVFLCSPEFGKDP